MGRGRVTGVSLMGIGYMNSESEIGKVDFSKKGVIESMRN